MLSGFACARTDGRVGGPLAAPYYTRGMQQEGDRRCSELCIKMQRIQTPHSLYCSSMLV